VSNSNIAPSVTAISNTLKAKKVALSKKKHFEWEVTISAYTHVYGDTRTTKCEYLDPSDPSNNTMVARYTTTIVVAAHNEVMAMFNAIAHAGIDRDTVEDMEMKKLGDFTPTQKRQERTHLGVAEVNEIIKSAFEQSGTIGMGDAADLDEWDGNDGDE
jgi:hypothetical protein